MAASVTNPEIETYAADHSTPEPPYLAAVAEATRAFSDNHSMMVGRLEGRFLEMLVGITGARRILEIGTFTGYSALAMAQALPPEGHLVTCEVDPRHAAKAREHIASSPHARQIELREGPALETIRSLDGTVDLVFIDADKTGYRDYYEAVLPILSPRGVIVVDNVLWSGRVLDPSNDDANVRALRAFNEMVLADRRVDAVLLPIRDGVSLIRRRS
jgi:caffeoyl-CoA O-methyltransferase